MRWNRFQGNQEKPIQPEIQKIILERSAHSLKRGMRKMHARVFLLEKRGLRGIMSRSGMAPFRIGLLE
jgi:hypothetical protein